MSDLSTPTLPASSANLRRLVLLRNIAIGGQLTALGVAQLYLGMDLRLAPVMMIIASLALFNLLAYLRMRRGWKVTYPEFLLHLLVDVAALTGVLYFTGGASNPFVLLLLMPLTIAAMVMPAGYTWAIATVTAACYSLLMWWYTPLPHEHGHMTEYGLHLFGMWLAFVLIAGLIAYFVVGMGNTVRRQAQALAAAREQALRDQQLVALGTLAASAAHQLGTPLATLALLAAELEEAAPASPEELAQRVGQIRQQVRRCKEVVGSLSASAGGPPLLGGQAMAVDRFLGEILDEWQGARPGSAITTRWEGVQPPPKILADRTLSQALLNILHNASDVSPGAVEWEASWDEADLLMEIRDRGPGLTEEASQSLGKRPYTTKDEGLGLGLFLSHAIIDRFGGKVKLFNRPGGGVCTRIQLPFTKWAGQLGG